MRSLFIIAVTAGLLAGCGDDVVDTSCDQDRPCPSGFVCSTAGQCEVVAPTIDAAPPGPPDAASPPDAAPPDAPPAANEPNTSITMQPPALDNHATVSFTFVADLAGSTFECRLDAAAFAACASPHSTPVTDGAHRFEVRATAGGVTETTPAVALFTTDTTPPETTISQAAFPDATAATFSFTASEPGTFACRLDGAALATCTSGIAYTGLGAGAHTFAVVATDLAGNADPTPATHTWTVEAALPDTMITNAPPAAVAATSATFQFVSIPSGADFECRLDSVDPADFAPCTSPAVYPDLGEGQHVFDVRARNAAGVDATPASYVWRVDLTGPDAVIDSSDVVEGVSCAHVMFSYITDPLEPAATFECALSMGPGPAGDAEYLACDRAGQSYAELIDATLYTFSVRAVDPLDNRGAPDTQTFTADSEGPAIRITSPGAATSGTSTVVEFTAPAEVGLSYTCILDDTVIVTGCQSGHVFSDLAEGPHKLRVEGTDRCNNLGLAETSFQVVIPTTVEITSIAAGATICPLGTLIFTTGGADSVVCAIDGEAVACDGSGFLNYGPLPGGTHTFTVTGHNQFGQVVGTDSVEVTVDAVGPSVVFEAAPRDGVTCSTAALYFQCDLSQPGANDCPASRYDCQLDSGDFVPCEEGRYPFVKLPAGPHTFAVRAADSCGNFAVTTLDWQVEGAPTSWSAFARAQRLAPLGSNDALNPKIVANQHGEAVMVWIQDNAPGDFGRNLYGAQRLANGEWENVGRLSAAEIGYDVSVPDLDINESGEVLIAWSEYGLVDATGYANRLYMARRAANGAWELPAINDFVSFDGEGYDVGMPSVALNDAGRALLTWTESEGDDSAQLYKAERLASGAWVYPRDMADHLSVNCEGAWHSEWDHHAANVALNERGDAVIAWQEADQVYLAQRRVAGKGAREMNGWELPLLPSDRLSAGRGIYPAVAINNEGDGLAVWTNRETGALARSELVNGIWGRAADFEGALAGGSFFNAHAIAINDAGLKVVAFSDFLGNIQTATNDKGTWGYSTVWKANNEELAPPPFQPGRLNGRLALALNNKGAAILGWQANPAGRPGTYYATRDAGGKWVGPKGDEPNLTYPEDDGGAPVRFTFSANQASAALLDDGLALITWTQGPDGADRSASSQIFRAEGMGGALKLPASYADSVSERNKDGIPAQQVGSTPLLAAYGAGNAIFAYTRAEGRYQRLFISELVAGKVSGPSDLKDAINPAQRIVADLRLVGGPTGQAIVAWSQQKVVEDELVADGLWVRERAPNGEWAAAREVSKGYEAARFNALAMNASGGAVLVNGTTIFERSAQGVWSKSATALGEVIVPQVAINDAGKVVIAAWGQPVDPDGEEANCTGVPDGQHVEYTAVYALERSAAGVWGEVQRISPQCVELCSIYGDGRLTGLDVDINSSGQAVAMFLARRGAYLSQRAADGKWTLPEVHATLAPGSGWDNCGITADVELIDSGAAVAAFEQRSQDGFGTLRVNLMAYGSVGGTWITPASPKDAISTPDARNSTPPKVAMNSQGKAMIVWTQSNGTSNSGTVMVSQRLAAGAAWAPTAPAPWLGRGENVDWYSAAGRAAVLENGRVLFGVNHARLDVGFISGLTVGD